MDRYLQGLEQVVFPNTTVMGSMAQYICNANPDGFQPMNANYGIIESIDRDKIKIKDQALYELSLWKQKV